MKIVPSKDVALLLLTAQDLGLTKLYNKFGNVLARKAVSGEIITTIIDGQIETTNIAKEDDIVIRNSSAANEDYITPMTKFLVRYSGPLPSFLWQEYKPIGQVWAFQYTGFDFEFVAPWGEPMICNCGDYIACPKLDNLGDVYRIERKAFLATYELSTTVNS